MEDEKKLLKVKDEKENTKAGVPADSFKGLQMDELISAPLIAVNEAHVKAPFLGLVPIPSLLIDDVNIDFQMEVTDASTSKNSEYADLSADVTPKWFGISVNGQGKVEISRENTRSTDQTAKYQVRETVSQQQQTEGLAKLMDIMASCIEPLDTKK